MNIRRFVITALKRFRQTYDESISTGLPSGGTAGQALVKKSVADGDAEWAARASIVNHPGSDYVTVTDGANNRISLATAGGVKVRCLISGENIGDADPDEPDLLVTDKFFVIKGASKDNFAIAAGGRSNAEIQVIKADDDYQIVGFKRVYIDNASEQGANRDGIALQSMSTGGGGKQAQIAVLNTGTAPAKIKIAVECFCMAGTLQ